MSQTVEELERQIYMLKEQLAEARRNAEPEPIQDFELHNGSGPIKLSALFGAHEDLLVIHNMGASCSYCTLWADGLNTYLPLVASRMAAVLVSPDDPETQARLAAHRGWKFRVVSDQSRKFTTAMGFYGEEGWAPGASGFRRVGDRVYRTNKTNFGPGDDFCPVWPLMDLVGGPKGWEPGDAFGN
ncbi:MAG: DUF899 family protein [Fimbriimonadaceae bacterium]|nr:DUF899 family protein [Fimbriimonadaceae bacterium]QYK55311.1 MAG: DUF899 family protein [Fimbriimonadaceae bacterium]